MFLKNYNLLKKSAFFEKKYAPENINYFLPDFNLSIIYFFSQLEVCVRLCTGFIIILFILEPFYLAKKKIFFCLQKFVDKKFPFFCLKIHKSFFLKCNTFEEGVNNIFFPDYIDFLEPYSKY